MTQTPHTPAGWYPVEGGERWWNGSSWSEHTRTPPAPAPVGYPPVPGHHRDQLYGEPWKAPPSNRNRNVLVVVLLIFLVFVCGFVALVALVAGSVDDSSATGTASDREAGGGDTTATVVAGRAFDVAGFAFAEGWSVSSTEVGTLQVVGLRVTNLRPESADAFVELTFRQGAEVVAGADCLAPGIAPGQTVTLGCVSADPLPAAYDRVTITDAF